MASNKAKREKRKLAYTNTKKVLENYDSGGFTPTCWNLPSGMKMYKWKKGKNKLDFMPFVVGKHNPNADPGSVHWERTYFTHEIPTADGTRKYPCLQKNFGLKCPICARLTKMKQNAQGDPEAIKKMDIKTRRAFLVIDRNDKEAGIQLLESGHFKSFGELIQNTLMALDDDSVFLDFYHLADGSTLNVQGVDDSFQGRTYVKPAVITFEPRKVQYDEDMIEEIPCLDDLLKKYEFKDLLKIFDQSENDEEEEEEKPKKKASKADDDDEEEEEGDDTDSDDEDNEEESDDSDDEEEGDDDDDDEGNDSDDDEEESDDDSDDSDDDSDESDYVPKVKDKVKVKHNKKTVIGTVTKVNKGNEMALVEIKGERRPVSFTFDELTPVEDEPADEDDGDEDEKPSKSKRMGKGKDEDDEDFDFDSDSDDEDDELDEDEVKAAPRRK